MKITKKLLSILLSIILALGVCSAGIIAYADMAVGQEYDLKGLNPDDAVVRPTLTISSETLDYDVARNNRVRDVTLTVSGAANKYAPTGLHIKVDSRLRVVTQTVGGKTIYAKLGDAGEYLSQEQWGYDNGFFVATAASEDVGQNGVLWKFQVELPEDIDPAGDNFPIQIEYRSSSSGADMFTNGDRDEQGQLMQAYVFTKGITHGGIKVGAQSVQKKTPELSVDISGTYCDGIVACSLTTNVTGFYYIFLDGEFYTYPIEGSTTFLDLNTLPSVPMAAGSHSVTVRTPETDEYKSGEITKEFTIPAHEADYPSWNWDDVDHPVYTQKCTECGATLATGTVDSTKGETAEATVDADGYTWYSASVIIGDVTYGQEIKIIDEGSMLAKRKEAFEEYKSFRADFVGNLAQEGDSAACAQLITSAQESIAGLEYDEELSLEKNKERVDNIMTEVETALAEHRRQYTATFVNEYGDTVGEAKFTMDTLMLDASDMPAVPAKTGFTGLWEAYELGTKDITIHPVYTAIEYTATFVNEAGETVKTETFTVKSESIAEPAVPEKAGYEGKWSEYTIAAADIEIRPVYTVIEYTATFVDENGTKIAEVPFTVESESIEEPAVPEKAGYDGKWSEYTIAAADIEIRPVYTVIEYTATFVDENGTKIAEVPFTVESESIEAPAVPEKGGYEAAWEEYEIGAGDLTIKPVYTPTDICPLDGEYHGTSFWGKLTKFLHTVIWKAFNLIGLNVYFRIS